jgi:hypothetical protein
MTLYGECIGADTQARVRISSLVGNGCEVEVESPQLVVVDGELALWIGAVGPFRATASRCDRSRLMLRFEEPLDPKILDHFQSV